MISVYKIALILVVIILFIVMIAPAIPTSKETTSTSTIQTFTGDFPPPSFLTFSPPATLSTSSSSYSSTTSPAFSSSPSTSSFSTHTTIVTSTSSTQIGYYEDENYAALNSQTVLVPAGSYILNGSATGIGSIVYQRIEVDDWAVKSNLTLVGCFNSTEAVYFTLAVFNSTQAVTGQSVVRQFQSLGYCFDQVLDYGSYYYSVYIGSSNAQLVSLNVTQPIELK